jgi:hypothetical protein
MYSSYVVKRRNKDIQLPATLTRYTETDTAIYIYKPFLKKQRNKEMADVSPLPN